MEIFDSTYMRPRYSPCLGTKGTTEKAEIELICCFSHKLGFSIVVLVEKNLVIFQLHFFGEKQHLQTLFTLK
jgi:hypothetical protein